MIRLEHVSKQFAGKRNVTALSDVTLSIPRGEMVSIIGPSGSGKSTLLNLVGGLDRPSAGEVRVDGQALGGLSDDELTRVRRDKIGFVFQFFNLLPTLTIVDNIALPCLLSGMPPSQATGLARQMADRVGISNRLPHYPQQVSGGEMQRAAIARALVHNPALLIADEPTGNLDSDNGARVLDLIRELNRETGITILLATHAAEVAAAASRVVRMRDGRFDDGAAAV